VVLSIFRDGAAFPMSQSFELRDGDIASIAIHRSDLEESLETLKQCGWMAPEDAVEVEAAS
jgi:Trk K+ transport system NAD-binding subunit